MAAEKIPITTTITFLMKHHDENMQTANSIAFFDLCTKGKILQAEETRMLLSRKN